MFIHEGTFFDYCDMAVEYIEKHNREKAEECIEEAAKLSDWVGVAGEYPNYASVFFEIANIYSDKKNYGKAIEYYEIARKEYICYSEGYYYANRSSLECYEKAIALKPDYVYAYNDIGIAYRFKGDYDKAIEYYGKALALNPDYTEAYNNLGIVYVDKENYDMAMECYEKAAESDADKAKIAYCNMGNAFELKGDYGKAIESWEKAIALDRYFAEAYYYIGKAYEAIGDKDKAAEYKPNTAMGLIEYLDQFPTEEAAREHIEKWRWGGNVTCPHCGEAKVHRLPDTLRKKGYWQCNGCRRQFSVRTKSVFQNSNLSFRKWLHAFYVMVTARKGDSSMHLSKELRIMQRHGWFLEHRIRDAMGTGKYDTLLAGTVEIDETFVGGKKKNMHTKEKKKLEEQTKKQGSGTTEMAIVFGGRERGSNRAVSFVIPNRTKETLQGSVEFIAAKESIVNTDEYASYTGLDKLGYEHKQVNHKAKIFVDKMASTNGVESMWACLKRGFYGTFHKFSLKHLQRYIDEFDFRWNKGNCKHKTMERVECLVGGCFGKYLSYKQLIGKTRVVCVNA